MNRKKLRHDRHTVSLLTDHMVFARNTGARCLFGDVAMICEGIICETYMETISGRLAVSLGMGGRDVVEKFIREQDRYEYLREIKKTIATGLVTFVRGIPECCDKKLHHELLCTTPSV